MLQAIRAVPLWKDGNLVLNGCPTTINCDILQTARWAWLVPNACCGNNYRVSFTAPDANMQDVLQGAWISLPGGSIMVLNVNSVDDLVTACAQCCDSPADVAKHYLASFQIPAEIPVTPQQYCFEREDTGSQKAYMDALYQYFGQYIPDTFTRDSRTAGKTKYCFLAYGLPAFLQNDTPFGTAINGFASNIPPALGFNQLYSATVSVGGTPINTPAQATSLQALLAFLQSDPDYSTLGTWGLNGNRITLLSSETAVSITVNIIDLQGQIFYSNDAPTNGPDQLFELQATVDGSPLVPPIYGYTLNDMVLALNGFTDYPAAGNWFVDGDTIALASATAGAVSLTITGGHASSPRTFDSNNAPVLQSGNTYNFTVNVNGSALSPVFLGDSLALLLAQIQATPAYTALGTWSIQGGNHLSLQSPNSNTVMNTLLVVDQVVKPPFIVDSNAAPTLSAGQHLSLAVTVDLVAYPPDVTGATLAELLGALQALAPYSTLGTWSIDAGNKIRLTTTTHDSGGLVLTASSNFISNTAPTLSAGNTYTLTAYVDNVALPAVVGDTLAIIVANITAGHPDYTALGSFVANATTIQLNNPTKTNVWLEIGQIVKPPFILDSNAAPTLSAGQHYEMTATLELTELTPHITGTTVQELADNAQNDATYNAYGTWTLQDTNKVRLTSTTIDNGGIQIDAVNDAPFMAAASTTAKGTQQAPTTTKKKGKTGSSKKPEKASSKGTTKKGKSTTTSKKGGKKTK